LKIANVDAADWIAGARVRTLPAAVVPVAVGTGVVIGDGDAVWWRALLAGGVALALQLGTNYANDYSDGIRGTDDERVGPVRLVASNIASPRAVKSAAFLCFGVAAVAGLVLASVASWWLLVVGASAIAAGWFYTGGSRPYGYSGFGEIFVFVFFGVVATVVGVVATVGTAFVQAESVPAIAWLASIPVGLLAVALLITNNLRDIAGDTQAGKRTLAVRMGDARTRQSYVAILLLAFATVAATGIDRPWALLALLAAPLSIGLGRIVLGGASGRELIAVLAGTGRLHLAFGALFTVGLAVG